MMPIPVPGVIENLLKWTHKDPVLIEHMKTSDEKRIVMDEKLHDLTKATLDSEDGWMLRLVETKDPVCVLKVVSACPDVDPEKGQ